jgi:hypothetical protein
MARLGKRAHFCKKLGIVCVQDSANEQTEGRTISTNYINSEVIYILVEKLMLAVVIDSSVTQ